DLATEQLEGVVRALLAGRQRRVDIGASEERRLRAEGEPLEHLGATAPAAIHEHLDPTAGRAAERGAHGGRGGAAVEHVAAVVRNHDGVDALVHGAARVTPASPSGCPALRKPTDERIAGIEIRCPRTVVASSRSEWNTAPRGRNITSSNTSTLRS